MALDINSLTYGEMKHIAALVGGPCDCDCTSVPPPATLSPFIGRDVIVRTYSAGVFYGTLEAMNGTEAVVNNARRVWKWSGAASLSQLSLTGTTDPDNCMFPAPVPEVHLTEVIEVLLLSPEAKKSLDGVKIWQR